MMAPCSVGEAWLNTLFCVQNPDILYFFAHFSLVPNCITSWHFRHTRIRFPGVFFPPLDLYCLWCGVSPYVLQHRDLTVPTNGTNASISASHMPCALSHTICRTFSGMLVIFLSHIVSGNILPLKLHLTTRPLMLHEVL